MTNLNFMLNPKSVAVVGASKTPGKIGYAILKNIVDSGYQNKVIPINPNEKELLGYPCASSISKAGAVDIAVIAVPEKVVNEVARECGEAGVKGLVVVSAGFKEVGPEGAKREKELMEICRNYNMRLVGPNCVGLIDTHTPLNASFTAGTPFQGDISFISQSGAMLVSILDWSLTSEIGFSKFISLGNKADLNEVDFINVSADDPQTNVILCYIEDVVEGERFLKATSEASKKKPVVILKSGASASGAQAASSHTGALAGSDKAYEIAFRQGGALRAENMNELFELAVAFSMSPLPSGDRVAIITNAGGPGIVATDAVEKSGLQMARFDKKTIDYFQENLPVEANIYNPIDVLGDAGPDRYYLAMEAAMADENTDNVIVMVTPAAITNPSQIAHYMVELNKKYPDKPIFAVYMGGKSMEEGIKVLNENRIPSYTFPEQAIHALKGMVQYSRFKEELKVEPEPMSVERDQNTVKSIFYDVLKEKRLVLRGDETSKVAQAYNLPVQPIYLAKSASQAKSMSDELGYPLVMKISSPDIMHKSDVGGIEVGLQSADAVEKAYDRMMKKVKRYLPKANIYGVELQQMADEGTELIIGMSRDVQFGPMIAFGLGGIYVNLIEDVSFRLASALTSPEEIKQMIKETKAYTMLKGYRGSKQADMDTLINTIGSVARLVQDFDEITELDINPLRVYPQGASALDIKITISSFW